MYLKETIIAPATGNQASAIAVLRISGDKAIEMTEKIFESKFNKKLKNQVSHTLHFGDIKDNATWVDEVLVAIFEEGKSFTGEETVEISCHGSLYIQNKIIDLFLKNGARLALPGEFTMRAFQNGRFDLTQAEAIADLIASDSKASHQVAMHQMRGGISTKLGELRKELIKLTALLELELDFSEDDVEFADRSQLTDLLKYILKEIQVLMETFAYGNAIKKGVPVAIIGKPNAGKSTLLNQLLNEERAIVSDIAGTTRDTIEEAIQINGINFRFIDTAGIRETEDEIEKIGVQRAIEKAQSAKILLYLFNTLENTEDEIDMHLSALVREDLHVILVHNKIDLNAENQVILDQKLEEKYQFPLLKISAKNGIFIEDLKRMMFDLIQRQDSDNQIIITNQRHLDALQKAHAALTEAQNAFIMQIPSDLIAQNLREGIKQIGNITGEIDVDRDILGTIFSEFCIGK